MDKYQNNEVFKIPHYVDYETEIGINVMTPRELQIAERMIPSMEEALEQSKNK